MKTPRERMIQTVRWYLSAFHAGRPSEVAKKPYNPIQGEIFRCFWKIPGSPESTVNFFLFLNNNYSFIYKVHISIIGKNYQGTVKPSMLH
jgi:hypothetical protein